MKPVIAFAPWRWSKPIVTARFMAQERQSSAEDRCAAGGRASARYRSAFLSPGIAR
jgi:hypothetical protein